MIQLRYKVSIFNFRMHPIGRFDHLSSREFQKCWHCCFSTKPLDTRGCDHTMDDPHQQQMRQSTTMTVGFQSPTGLVKDGWAVDSGLCHRRHPRRYGGRSPDLYANTNLVAASHCHIFSLLSVVLPRVRNEKTAYYCLRRCRSVQVCRYLDDVESE